MELTVKGKHLDVGDSLREHVRSNLTTAAAKYFREPIEATVVFTKEKNHRYKADISIHVGHGIVLEAHNEADDPYPAFDGASKNVVKRLSKFKDRLKDHHKRQGVSETTAAAYTTFAGNENEAEGGKEPAVIAEMDTQVPTLAVADAVLRLELGNAPALLFKNPGHGGYNMVYRRKDGNIGWVDPDGSAPKKKPVKEEKPAAKAAPAKAAPAKATAKQDKKKAKAGKRR